MVTIWLRNAGILALSAAALGCATSKTPDLRTPMPEQYTLPPDGDARFTQPVSYPKDVLEQEPIKAASAGKLPSQQQGIAPAGGMNGRGGAPGGF